jgi:hypothetical protein
MLTSSVVPVGINVSSFSLPQPAKRLQQNASPVLSLSSTPAQASPQAAFGGLTPKKALFGIMTLATMALHYGVPFLEEPHIANNAPGSFRQPFGWKTKKEATHKAINFNAANGSKNLRV